MYKILAKGWLRFLQRQETIWPFSGQAKPRDSGDLTKHLV